MLGTSYVLQHSEYRGDFVDELRGALGGSFRRYTQLRIDRGFKLGARMLATNLVADRTQRAELDRVERDLPSLDEPGPLACLEQLQLPALRQCGIVEPEH